jgi:hypothetical protein
MKLFRRDTVTRIFSLFTAVIFLNMGFFLAEACLLNFEDRNMIENVCSLVLNGGLEEERDAHSSGNDAPLKFFSFLGADLSWRHSSLFLIASKAHRDFEDHYVHADHSETFSPPPDLSVVLS